MEGKPNDGTTRIMDGDGMASWDHTMGSVVLTLNTRASIYSVCDAERRAAELFLSLNRARNEVCTGKPTS